jgi:hypothetical protein
MTKIISIVGGMQPSAPTIGTATGGDASASVAFTASSYIGKGTITYTATSSPGGLTATGASSPLTVSGLTNGTAYTFTVVGNTNYGVASVASAASNSITPAAASDYESIATYTLTGSVSNVEFTSIPDTYKHLQIRFICRTTRATAGSYMRMQYNSDTASNYADHGLRGTGSGGAPTTDNASSQTWMSINRIAGSTAPSNVFGVGIIDILDYTNTNKKKVSRYIAGLETNQNNTNSEVWFGSGLWNVTTTISSIKFLEAVTGDFVQYSQFALYGYKG